MPSKTPAQAKLMRAVAHGWKPDRMKGPSRKVAKEFVAADKKAKGYQFGGLIGAKKLRKLMEEAQGKLGEEQTLLGSDLSDKLKGTMWEKLLFEGGDRRPGGHIGKVYQKALDKLAAQQAELQAAEVPPENVTTQPIPGEGGLLEETPPLKDVAPPPLRAEIPERLRGTIAGAGQAPPALMRYLQTLQGPEPEPVKMQWGGMMGRGFGRAMQKALPQVPPGGGLQQFAQEGRVPGGGGGRSQLGRTMQEAMQKLPRQGQPPGGAGPQQRPQPQPRPPGGGGPTRGPEWGGSPEANQDFGRAIGQMKGIGRAPGAGVPLRGVGRPPGMGRPGAGGGAGDYQSMLQQRQQQATGGARPAVMPGRQFMPGGGGAGMPGGANRIGMGDQQGALARATQVQTGRPPMSRRQPFPGRGGPGGGFGRRRGRGRGRMRR